MRRGEDILEDSISVGRFVWYFFCQDSEFSSLRQNSAFPGFTILSNRQVTAYKILYVKKTTKIFLIISSFEKFDIRSFTLNLFKFP